MLFALGRLSDQRPAQFAGVGVEELVGARSAERDKREGRKNLILIEFPFFWEVCMRRD